MNEYRIVLDKERVLKFSNRSFMELEKRIGKSVVSIFVEAAQITDEAARQRALMDAFSKAEFITAFIYCGLLHEKVSYDNVVDLIPVNKYMEVMILALRVLPEEYGLSAKGETEDKKKEGTE